jgi:release factor glutamine methyltransferase
MVQNHLLQLLCLVGMEPPTDQSSVDSAGPVTIPHMGARGRQTGTNKAFRVLDLGTGCGAIALTIAHSRPNVDVVAVDNSADALAVARENAERLLQPLIRQDDLSALTKHATNLHLVQGNWFEKLSAQQFDLIVSNPPYVAIGDPHILQGDLRFEPLAALVSGDDGLNDIRHIIMHAPAYLRPGGWLMLEHGYNQAVAARRLLQETGFTSIYSARDLAGIERVSAGQLA